MKILLLVSITILAGCSLQSYLAVKDCENIGYVKGSPEFVQCAEHHLAVRREAIREKRQQEAEIAVEREKASHGLFGRTPICNTTSYGSGTYSQECK